MSAVLERSRAQAATMGGRIARTFYKALQGPYTSVVLTDESTGLPMTVPVNERTALSISAVYRSTAIYADLIGTMPVHRYRGTDSLPAPGFVLAPRGAEVGWQDEIGQMLRSLLLRGNAYAVPTAYDAEGWPVTFQVLDPQRVDVRMDDRQRVYYRYRFAAMAGANDVWWIDPGPTALLHVRWQRPPGAELGIGILDANAYPGSSISAAWAANAFSAAMMASPTPPAVITHPMRLNKEQAEQLQEQWANSVARSRALPAVLSGGITFQPLQITARDAQLIESRRWNATDIATFFGLPAYMVGGSTGDSLTYSTVEGEMLRLWTTALMPMAVRLERALSAWCPHLQRLRFVPDALLRSQTLDRYQAHKIALEAGFKTVAEVRDLENLPPMAPPPPAPAPPPPPPLPPPEDSADDA